VRSKSGLKIHHSLHPKMIQNTIHSMTRKPYAWLLGLTITVASPLKGLDLYVAPNGSDNNPGTLAQPLQTMEGAKLALSGVNRNQTIRVNFRAGTYFPTRTVFRTADGGANGNPIVYRSYPGETAFFDGAEFVDNSSFSLASGSLANRIPAVARGKTYVQVISDPRMQQLLSDPNAIFSVNSRPQFLATYPNVGFLTATDRVAGTGNGSHDNPTGDVFSVAESFPHRELEAELLRGGRQVYADGYLDTEFARRRTPVGRTGGTGASRFVLTGITGAEFTRVSVSRCRIANFLYGLDSPGEWYFDTTDNRLYFWPLSGQIGASDRIGVTGGERPVECFNSSNLRFEKLVFRNIGGTGNGVIWINGSSNIEVAGCTFQSNIATQPPVNISEGSSNNKVTSCDFIDNGRAMILSGGSFNQTSVTAGGNVVDNCHFGNWQSRHIAGTQVSIVGAGNTLRNSVFHNIGSQAMVHRGVDHNVVQNEFFNVGFEEGDGGATYTGANFFSFGNLFRNNFAHHLIQVPGLIGRSAFFSDDYDAGETYDANVVYKCGDTGIKMNAGSGHTVTANVVISCRRGIALLGRPETYERNYNVARDLLRTDPNRDSKPNYIGRAEKVLGDFADNATATYNQEWDNSFWGQRYSLLRFMLRNPDGRLGMYPTQNRFYENGFQANSIDAEASPGFAAIRGSQQLANSRFENVNNLNFQFTSVPTGMKNIPFGNIGLRTDSYRSSVPNKNSYRNAIRQRYSGESSFRNERYNSGTVNALVYYNSGPLLMPDSQSGLGVKLGDATKNPAPPRGTVVVNLAADRYDYDLGTDTSPVLNGFQRISQITRGDITWSVAPRSVDRGSASGANAANRDLVFNSTTTTLSHKIANGVWTVVLNMGDASAPHDQMQVSAEGGQIVRGSINSNPGQFTAVNFDVNVSDGQLNLVFSDEGGSDANWVATRLSLVRKGDLPTGPANTVDSGPFVDQNEYFHDFGTEDSPVFNGYSKITQNTTQGYVRWASNNGIDSRDRGSGNNDLNRDFVFSSQARTLIHQVTNGAYKVTLNLFDANGQHDNMQVRAEGAIKLTNQTWGSSAGNQTLTFDVDVSDGALNLEFSDQGGSDQNWVLNRVIVAKDTSSSPPPPSGGGAFTSTADIGSASPAGSTTDNGSGSFTVQGSGGDIWGTADAFQFASDAVTTSTGELTVRIASLTNTNVWAKAGVHYRDSNTAGSKNVGVYVRPDGQVAMQWRDTTNGASSWHGTLLGGTGLAKWARLTKDGDSYTGAWSANGTSWTNIRTVTVNMGNDNLGGLALTSHANSTLATAVFTNYSSNWESASTAPPAGITPPTGLIQLEFRHSGKCVDNKAGTTNGVEYHQWTCGTHANRNFTFTSLGGGYYSIKSEKSNRCLDVANGSLADGGKLHQWDCDSGNVNQSWKLDDRGNGWFQLVSRRSDKCVDVENSGTGNSAKILQKNCDTTKQSQQLRFK